MVDVETTDRETRESVLLRVIISKLKESPEKALEFAEQYSEYLMGKEANND